MAEYDVIVAGGGIAGSSTALALARVGQRVLVCEAGLPTEKRLAGELLHPPAVADLEALGVLDDLLEEGVPTYGFAVIEGPKDRGTLLSYSEIPGARASGLAIEHAVLTRRMLARAAEHPNITVLTPARVSDPRQSQNGTTVRVKQGTQTHDVEAPLLVSAEGRASKLRRWHDIVAEPTASYRMIGWKIPHARLPHPGYGHVFLGGSKTALAYQMSATEVRVMFELDEDGGLEVPRDVIESLPRPFREDVLAAMAREKGQVAKVIDMKPTRAIAPNFAVVGDAGGCAHPLTASGIAYCVGDARRLACALTATGAELDGDRLDDALIAYEADRDECMRSRMVLAPALREALYPADDGMRLLRHGLMRYWNQSTRGRKSSLALLSTLDQSLGSMALQYASVSLHALDGVRAGVLPLQKVPQAFGQLARRNLGFLQHALRL
jgi:2-polyprenyl-6-methoxyphenol hydroxylase-like FAD-dependent oxidoreductase